VSSSFLLFQCLIACIWSDPYVWSLISFSYILFLCRMENPNVWGPVVSSYSWRHRLLLVLPPGNNFVFGSWYESQLSPITINQHSFMLLWKFMNILSFSHFPSCSEVLSFLFHLFLFSFWKNTSNYWVFLKFLNLCCIRVFIADLYHSMYCTCSLFYQVNYLSNMDPLYLSPIFSFFFWMYKWPMSNL
jgi:hypothetical protein